VVSAALCTGDLPTHNAIGATEARGQPEIGLDATTSDDFLRREKAALGDDANQFASPHDNLATVEDAADDDLLGGSSTSAGQDMGGMTTFESSFPVIDSQNEVSRHCDNT
jgi:hypothetical protein